MSMDLGETGMTFIATAQEGMEEFNASILQRRVEMVILSAFTGPLARRLSLPTGKLLLPAVALTLTWGAAAVSKKDVWSFVILRLLLNTH